MSLEAELQKLKQRVNGSIQQALDMGGYTDVRYVKTGDGEAGTVLVPLAEREYPDMPTYWVHVNTAGGIAKMQVLNLPGSGITMDNSAPGIDYVIAKPPGYKRHALICPSETGQAMFQGGAPLLFGMQQASSVTQDRIVEGAIRAGTGLVLKYTGGVFRSGDTLYAPSGDTTWIDLSSPTDYRPSTTDYLKWLVIGVDSSGAAQITAGDEFSNAETNYLDFQPTEIPTASQFCGYVLLSQGLTQLIDGTHVFSKPAVPYVPTTGEQGVNYGAPQTKLISTGELTITTSFVYVSAESGTTDDLVTIAGLTTGRAVMLRATTGHTITIKVTGNIHTVSGTDTSLTSSTYIPFIRDGSDFYQIT